MKTAQIEWHTFLPDYLVPDAFVLDLGANAGRFSMEIIRRYGCRCVAVEPSPTVFASIPAHPRLVKQQIAICVKTGPVAFTVSTNSEESKVLNSASVSESNRVISVPGIHLEQFCQEQHLEQINLLKMDIEGQEIAVLESCSDAFLMRIDQITVEFHDFCGLTSRLDIKRTIRRLEALGFWAVRMSGRSYLDTLFINRRCLGLSVLTCLWIQHWERNFRGLCRVVRRLWA